MQIMQETARNKSKYAKVFGGFELHPNWSMFAQNKSSKLERSIIHLASWVDSSRFVEDILEPGMYYIHSESLEQGTWKERLNDSGIKVGGSWGVWHIPLHVPLSCTGELNTGCLMELQLSPKLHWSAKGERGLLLHCSSKKRNPSAGGIFVH